MGKQDTPAELTRTAQVLAERLGPAHVAIFAVTPRGTGSEVFCLMVSQDAHAVRQARASAVDAVRTRPARLAR